MVLATVADKEPESGYYVAMSKPVSVRSTVVAAEEQVSSELGGEVAILGLKTGMYYGLEEIGARIWSLLQEPRTVHDLRDTLVSEYDVEPSLAERDLLAVLGQMASEGLIEVRDETTA